jgi:hypothetical protein
MYFGKGTKGTKETTTSFWAIMLTYILCRNGEGRILNIVSDYETSCKEIGELYYFFKKEYKIPCNLLEDIIKCDNLNFYYSEDEKTEYIEYWKSKSLMTIFIPYSLLEYNFYLIICLENQHYPDLQIIHYKDGGCICIACSHKRNKIYKELRNNPPQQYKELRNNPPQQYKELRNNPPQQENISVIHEQCIAEYNKHKLNKLAELITLKKQHNNNTNKNTIQNHIKHIVYK